MKEKFKKCCKIGVTTKNRLFQLSGNGKMSVAIYGMHVGCQRNIISEKVAERNKECVVFWELLSTFHKTQ